MQANFTLALLIFINDVANCQQQTNKKVTIDYVTLKYFYDGQGIVFSKNDYFLKSKKSEQQINLTESDVVDAEVVIVQIKS